MSDRVVTVPGLHNLRDLGGLSTVDGRRVRTGRLFRSDYPALDCSDDVERAVSRLRLKTVLDLRARAEAEHECVAWTTHGIRYQRIPISSGESSWDAGYDRYLTHRPGNVVAAVGLLLGPDSGPVLFHCAAGKDRTGAVAALLLSALGVGEAEIVTDYTLSGASVAAVLSRLAGVDVYRDVLRNATVTSQTPRADSMRRFLSWLRDQGGAASWLVANGLGPETLDVGKRMLLTDLGSPREDPIVSGTGRGPQE